MSDFFANFNPLVLCIPLISGFIGWFTNWIAVKATLHPVEFVGIPPLLGWQGVVPKNTEELAKNFSRLLRDYQKLYKTAKRLMRLSDRNELELSKLAEQQRHSAEKVAQRNGELEAT